MQLKTIQQSVIKICLFQHPGTVGEGTFCYLLLSQEIRRFTDFFEIFFASSESRQTPTASVHDWFKHQKKIAENRIH